MVSAIYGKKLGCTQIFNESGNALYVTAIEAEPCIVVQVKDDKKDGYNALKVGFGKIKERKATKPHEGEFSKNKVDLKRSLKEIRVDKFDQEYKPGDSLDVKIFKVGDKVKITGNSKGKGFAGVIKRHGFHRGRMSHGSHSHRIPGSVGMCSTPSRIAKGKKMPGRMGGGRVTVPGSEIVDIIEDQNLILVKGSVPGAKGSLVFLRKVQ
ncbi:MAG: 50S ribosomal protein L3 [Actinobacteria bacterium RBG_13_35_12]|jgi:large subunit ribosomal protein L3|nr:MAG: 50S ribosomal protein L3 [Actinobacteria bacterium RBG_13_35_12]